MARKAHTQALPNPQEETTPSLEELLAEMRVVPTEGEYYTLTLSTSREGKIIHGYQSHFAGFTTGSPRRELRAPSTVYPEKMIAIWDSLKFPWMVVNNMTQFSVFLLRGGNALVKKSLADEHLSHFYSEVECGYRGSLSPPILVSALAKEEKQRAPTAKLRTEVLTRDQDRCMKCGNRPFDNPHVQLEVHHIRPWALGGLTTKTNLITLCHTCHTGLEPHIDLRLYNYVRPDKDPVKAAIDEQLYEQTTGIIEYRKKALAQYSKLGKKKAKSGSPRRRAR